MKIILLQDVKNIGKKGDVKEVADGYALNFILPKKLGVQATTDTIQQAEGAKAKKIEEENKLTEQSKSLIEKLKSLQITLKAKEKEGKLFGSITTKDIAAELKNRNFDIPEKCIKLEEVIKKIGEYKVTVDLGQNITSHLVLKIEAQE